MKFAYFPPSSQTKPRHLPKRNYAKPRNELLPSCGIKLRQIAEKFQKYLHISIIFTTFAAFFKYNKLWKAINHVLQISY